ncbi:MAG: polyprenyl synthetase family protein [Nocardioidaceae bacterium]
MTLAERRVRTLQAPQVLHHSRDLILPALHDAVLRLDPSMRSVVSYHLGWSDENGEPAEADGGKAVRPGLALLSAEAGRAPREVGVPGAVAVELVHNFSLVHDDVMDHDETRRHRRTVWAVWGTSTAILAGDAMLSLAHEVLLDPELEHGEAAGRLLASATRELIRGQVQDLAFESRADVSLDACLDMAAGKTGALLSASAAVGAVLADASPAVVEALAAYGSHLGIAFQLVDDLLGIWGDPAVTGKPVFSDLRARKCTLPVTYVLEQGGSQGRLLAELLTDPSERSDQDLAAAADLVESGGGRRWAQTETGHRAELAEQALDSAPIPPDIVAELLQLGRFLVSREA